MHLACSNGHANPILRNNIDSLTLAHRLDSIDNRLDSQSRAIDLLLQQPRLTHTTLNLQTALSPPSDLQASATSVRHDAPIWRRRPSEGNVEDSPIWRSSRYDAVTMNIPWSHSTTTASLLRTAEVQSLLGDFPPDIFLKAEASRPIPDCLSLNPRSHEHLSFPPLLQEVTDRLVEAYFAYVHVEVPILNKGSFLKLYDRVSSQPIQKNIELALCLVVFALGFVTTSEPSADDLYSKASWAPGGQYLSPALDILMQEYMTSFGTSIILPQALLLAAKYFGHVLRPLQSWKLTHMASTNIQHLCHLYAGELFLGTQEEILTLQTRMNLHPQQTNMASDLLLTSWAIFDLER